MSVIIKNVYFVVLHRLYPANSGLDAVQWLCRDCAAKRHAYPQTQYAVAMSDVCEQCGAKQIAFPVGAIIERKRKQKGARTMGPGLLAVDWIHPTRIGGDGWTRNSISFTGAKIASPEIKAKAEQYIQRVGLRGVL